MRRIATSSKKRPPEGLRSYLRKQLCRHVWRMDLDPTCDVALSAYLDRTWPTGVHVGPWAIIDEEAVVLTHDLTRGVRLDTRIGASCYIGPRAIIMPGVSIGDGAIVRAGSVVTRNVPPGRTVSGNPARELGRELQATGNASDCGAPMRRPRPKS
jgi:acetyltransferase-like isoleucine patch superfamily enzyme